MCNLAYTIYGIYCQINNRTRLTKCEVNQVFLIILSFANRFVRTRLMIANISTSNKIIQHALWTLIT
jgi:hypothetical protein